MGKGAGDSGHVSMDGATEQTRGGLMSWAYLLIEGLP